MHYNWRTLFAGFMRISLIFCLHWHCDEARDARNLVLHLSLRIGGACLWCVQGLCTGPTAAATGKAGELPCWSAQCACFRVAAAPQQGTLGDTMIHDEDFFSRSSMYKRPIAADGWSRRTYS